MMYENIKLNHEAIAEYKEMKGVLRRVPPDYIHRAT